ncbi:MAG: hypothetical protein FWD27_03600 [Coriobacteriia bacterium]|nr:hypothetical protein [Coriobacteriia bacterium]
MKKAGRACIVIAIIGLIIYLYKTKVIGYCPDERAILTIAAVLIVALVVVGIALEAIVSKRERANTASKLLEKSRAGDNNPKTEE